MENCTKSQFNLISEGLLSSQLKFKKRLDAILTWKKRLPSVTIKHSVIQKVCFHHKHKIISDRKHKSEPADIFLIPRYFSAVLLHLQSGWWQVDPWGGQWGRHPNRPAPVDLLHSWSSRLRLALLSLADSKQVQLLPRAPDLAWGLCQSHRFWGRGRRSAQV